MYLRYHYLVDVLAGRAGRPLRGPDAAAHADPEAGGPPGPADARSPPPARGLSEPS
jgi:hypothetical protein